MEHAAAFLLSCKEGASFEELLGKAAGLEGSPSSSSTSSPLAHITDAVGWSALHCACWSGDRVVVAWLLEVGCDVDASAEEGETPLLIACGRGHAKVVEMLLGKSTASVNVCDLAGMYPIHSAASYGSAEVVAALVRCGASVKVRNSSNLCAQDIAAGEAGALLAALPSAPVLSAVDAGKVLTFAALAEQTATPLSKAALAAVAEALLSYESPVEHFMRGVKSV